MSFLRVVGEFIVRPYEAFREHKGSHLLLSIVLGMLLSSPLMFALVPLMDSVVAGIALTVLIAALNVASTVLIFHLVSLLFGGRGKWQDLLSLYGFTTLPGLLPALVAVVIFAFSIVSFRSPTLPGVLTIANSGIIAYLVFDQAMKLAVYIYTGLALSTVYELKWTKVVGVILVSIIAGSFISGLFSGSFIVTRPISWKVMPLMLEQVEEVHISVNARNSLTLKPVLLEREELVLANLSKKITLRTAESANTYYHGCVLAKLVALPGDRVALDSGALTINGETVQVPSRPLPHLSLDEIELGPKQYFVYFTSPTLLGSETNPDAFVVTREQIISGVPHRMLAFLRRLTQ